MNSINGQKTMCKIARESYSALFSSGAFRMRNLRSWDICTNNEEMTVLSVSSAILKKHNPVFKNFRIIYWFHTGFIKNYFNSLLSWRHLVHNGRSSTLKPLKFRNLRMSIASSNKWLKVLISDAQRSGFEITILSMSNWVAFEKIIERRLIKVTKFCGLYVILRKWYERSSDNHLQRICRRKSKFCSFYFYRNNKRWALVFQIQ